MRTCPRCGCYIPDNWTTCPACRFEKTNKFYRVELFSDPYDIDKIYEIVFNRQDDALCYAQLSAGFGFVKSVKIWDSQFKEYLKIL